MVFSIFFVNSDFLAPLATRFLYIVNGQDASAGGRIYALTFLPESLFRVFGLGDQLQNTLNNSNYQAVDVGLAAFSLTYGFPFLFYTASIYFRLKKTVPHFALTYFLYILLIWSQSGNILSTDKFFATIIPFPLILISARLLEFNSLKSAPICTNYTQNLSDNP
jgi:hypothetical protein